MTKFNAVRSVSEELKQDFAITNNIAPPKTKKNKVGRRTIYPFSEMNVGDSFLVPCVQLCQQKTRSIYYSARHFKMNGNQLMDFQIEYQPEEKGIRVWRIA